MDNNTNQEHSFNIAELAQMAEQRKAAEAMANPTATTETVEESVGDVVIDFKEEEGAPVLPPVEETTETDPGEYRGPGLVIDDNYVTENDPEMGVHYTGMTPDTMANITAYMDNQESTIEALEEEYGSREELAKKIENDEITLEMRELKRSIPEEAIMTKDEFDDKYNNATIIIDKSNMGTVINFTDEERAKLKEVSSITVEEVETVEIGTIKTKKAKNLDIGKLIKRKMTPFATDIVLGASGYTARMGGLSAQEMINLFNPGVRGVTALQNKWSIVYDKMIDSSVRFKDFTDFCMGTAAIELDTLIFGMLCSTYPDVDTMPLKCDKCGHVHKHQYTVKSMIRSELISPRLMELIKNTVDVSTSELLAKKNHNESPVNQVKRIKLPDSGFILEIYLQSAYDLINKSMKELSDIDDTRLSKSIMNSTAISKVYIPDEDGSFFEIDDQKDIVDVLYNLSTTDDAIFRKITDDYLNDLPITYGLMGVECPECKTYTASIPMEIESMLFYKYQQDMTRKLK